MARPFLLFPLLAFLACQNAPASKLNSAEKIVWDFTESLNLAKEQTTLDSAGRLVIKSGPETDYFIEPGAPPYEKANAPLLLQSVDNTKPFTFSVKTTPVHTVKYDAGMVFLYVDAKQWLKFAFEADERLNHRIVTVKTRDFSDDNNHDAIQASSVYLKVSSDTKVVGFYYSTDGQQWQLVRVFKNEYPAVLKVGIGAQSPVGQGNIAIFEDWKFQADAVKDFRMGL